MYDTYTKLFTEFPGYDYGSPVWGNKCPTQLINVQKHAMRYFLGCIAKESLDQARHYQNLIVLHLHRFINSLILNVEKLDSRRFEASVNKDAS